MFMIRWNKNRTVLNIFRDLLFLGEVNQDGTIIDKNDEIVGYVDLGRATFRDRTDSHYGTMLRDGTVLDRNETVIGKISKFTFHDLKQVALYFFMFDPHFLEDLSVPVNYIDHLDLPNIDSNDEMVEVARETPVLISEFQRSLGKYYLIIRELGCPVTCLNVTLIEQGTKLTLSRKVKVDGIAKEKIWTINLPHPVVIDDLGAMYYNDTTTLTIYLEGSSNGHELNDTKVKIQCV